MLPLWKLNSPTSQSNSSAVSFEAVRIDCESHIALKRYHFECGDDEDADGDTHSPNGATTRKASPGTNCGKHLGTY